MLLYYHPYKMIKYIICSLTQIATLTVFGLLFAGLCILLAGKYAIFLLIAIVALMIMADAIFRKI